MSDFSSSSLHSDIILSRSAKWKVIRSSSSFKIDSVIFFYEIQHLVFICEFIFSSICLSGVVSSEGLRLNIFLFSCITSCRPAIIISRTNLQILARSNSRYMYMYTGLMSLKRNEYVVNALPFSLSVKHGGECAKLLQRITNERMFNNVFHRGIFITLTSSLQNIFTTSDPCLSLSYYNLSCQSIFLVFHSANDGPFNGPMEFFHHLRPG